MQKKTKWTAVGAASVLGLGLIAGGALTAAHASTVNVSDNSPAAATSGAAFGLTTTSDPIGSAPTTSPSASPTTSPTAPAAATPAATVDTASSGQTAPSIATAVSAPSVASPISPASPASPISAISPISPVSVD
ncbi:hypothetical protein [Salinibacterium sp. ZJ450]|uniref:hypothetical protein n=1 Tax=Salinibacterium sp. ZJ450 TaxID=2708338 RepID=UPI001420F9A8|nr:hypothetical protein [Salinibacterium sp. ZJ450]